MDLTHIDEEGRSRMVDVSEKPVTRRVAVASGRLRMSARTLEVIRGHRTPKGDPIEVARIAGVMAAKRTFELIPLCHMLSLEHIDLQIELQTEGIVITAAVTAFGRTGVEMEALTAVSVAALTLYDMSKAVDRSMVISDIRLESKTGGRSGDFKREGE